MISRGSRRYARWWFGLLNWSAPVLDPGEDPHGSVDLDGIPVDVGIAKLVEGLWDQGYETWGSCQGDPVLYRMSRCDFETMAYLTLATEHEALQLLHWIQAHPQVSEHRQTILSSNASAESPSGRFYFVSMDPTLVRDLPTTSIPPVRTQEERS